MLKESDSGIGVGNFGKAGVGKSESEILERSELETDIFPPTPQAWLLCDICQLRHSAQSFHNQIFQV